MATLKIASYLDTF